jgi:hypothetical protein
MTVEHRGGLRSSGDGCRRDGPTAGWRAWASPQRQLSYCRCSGFSAVDDGSTDHRALVEPDPTREIGCRQEGMWAHRWQRVPCRRTTSRSRAPHTQTRLRLFVSTDRKGWRNEQRYGPASIGTQGSGAGGITACIDPPTQDGFPAFRGQPHQWEPEKGDDDDITGQRTKSRPRGGLQPNRRGGLRKAPRTRARFHRSYTWDGGQAAVRSPDSRRKLD